MSDIRAMGVPALIDANRIDVELGAMQVRFRNVEFGKRSAPLDHHRFELTLQPFRPGADVERVAASLKMGLEVVIHPDGSIDPSEQGPPGMPVKRSRDLFRAYRVHVTPRSYPALPLVHVVDPIVDDRQFDVVHLLSGTPFYHPDYAHNSRLPRAALCYVAPNHIDWRHSQHTIASLMPDVVTWLASFALEKYGGVPWVVQGAPHDPAVLADTVHPEDSCPCYSGKPFKDCHQTAWRRVRFERAVRRQGVLASQQRTAFDFPNASR